MVLCVCPHTSQYCCDIFVFKKVVFGVCMPQHRPTAYHYISVLILLCMRPHTTYTCPHTTIYVSAYYSILVNTAATSVFKKIVVEEWAHQHRHHLYLRNIASRCVCTLCSYICVLMPLYMCPHTALQCSFAHESVEHLCGPCRSGRAGRRLPLEAHVFHMSLNSHRARTVQEGTEGAGEGER